MLYNLVIVKNDKPRELIPINVLRVMCGKIGFLPNGLMHIGAKLMVPIYV
jgi:hypothetical protein